MIDAQIFQEFTSAVHAAHDEVAFAGAASRLTEAIGFRWFTYLSLGGDKAAAMSTYPAIWSEHYFANAFDQVDPVVSASRQEPLPFFWGAFGGIMPENSKAARLFDDAASFGIVSGLTVPFRGPKGRTALFTLSTDEVSSGLHRQADGFKTFVQLCGLHLHKQLSSRVSRFMPAHRRRALTARQRACLAGAADGQSAKKVARTVGLTPRTVQHHFDEAKRRLEAESLPHAVALAFRRGLIS